MLLRNRFPTLFASATHKHITVNKWVDRFASDRNLGFDNQFALDARGELSQLNLVVRSTVLSDNSDVLCWRWSGNGRFNARSAYNFLAFDGVDDRRISHLWNIKIPLRIKIFLWLAATYRVLTADLLAKRGWAGPSICALCNSDGEFLEHLLFRCSFARAVWNRILRGNRHLLMTLLASLGDLTSRWTRSRRTLQGRAQTSLDLSIAATCWELWLERNHRIFDDHPTSAAYSGKRIASTINMWSNLLGG